MDSRVRKQQWAWAPEAQGSPAAEESGKGSREGLCMEVANSGGTRKACGRGRVARGSREEVSTAVPIFFHESCLHGAMC